MCWKTKDNQKSQSIIKAIITIVITTIMLILLTKRISVNQLIRFTLEFTIFDLVCVFSTHHPDSPDWTTLIATRGSRFMVCRRAGVVPWFVLSVSRLSAGSTCVQASFCHLPPCRIGDSKNKRVLSVYTVSCFFINKNRVHV